ncbi:MAG: hypothetical protein HFH35_01045 [Eubacterium sp.]|nr:hypothetical protein [Eubacterium sp.]
MQHEFLKQFPKRMKHVALYALLLANSSQKATWKQYGFLNMDEQVNLIFAVMLYLMEQSLKEETCTMDDIGAYIDTLNTSYFEKSLSYEDCRRLGDFIINVILSNDGRPMYFSCYDFEKHGYEKKNISYVANRIVYLDSEVKRTSYYLTDDGYNLLLGTLEMESNMKLTVHEMIFKMHLEKQSYDKAVDEVKNVFNLLRMQLQKIQEAMGRVRRNALNYSVSDYQAILEENMDTIRDTRTQFLSYRDLVKTRAGELEAEQINIRRLTAKEEENLGNLRIIEQYLNRAIDEYQKILNSHLDLKALYTKELEELSQMSLIQRFSLRSELYDQILEHPAGLLRLDYFLRPLLLHGPDQIYNLNKALELQRPTRKKNETESNIEEQMDFDEAQWLKEQELLRQKKLQKYRACLIFILRRLLARGHVTLQQLKEETASSEIQRSQLIPNTEIFKEIMVELLKSRDIDISALKQEHREFIQETSSGFQLNEMLLELLDELEPPDGKPLIREIHISRIEDGTSVLFTGVLDESGNARTIRCSNIQFQSQ